MAPTTASDKEPKAGPAQAGKESKGASATDVNFIFHVLKHNRVKLDVDWEAFAKDVGYGSGTVASTRYGQIRKKLGFGANSEKTAATAGGAAAGSPAAATGKVTKRTPKARAKAKNTAAAANLTARDAMIEQALQPNDADFDRDVDMDLTPTPAGRTKDALKPEADGKDDVDDDEADF